MQKQKRTFSEEEAMRIIEETERGAYGLVAARFANEHFDGCAELNLDTGEVESDSGLRDDPVPGSDHIVTLRWCS